MLTMKEDKNRSMKQERMLYRRMKEAEEAIEDAEEMMETKENYKMNCGKRKCEMGKRKPCK